jgi:hypothetical protein
LVLLLFWGPWLDSGNGECWKSCLPSSSITLHGPSTFLEDTLISEFWCAGGRESESQRDLSAAGTTPAAACADHTLGHTVLHIHHQAMPAKLRMRLPVGRLNKLCGSKWRPLTPRDHRLSRKQIQEDIHQNKTTRDAVQVCVAARGMNWNHLREKRERNNPESSSKFVCGRV